MKPAHRTFASTCVLAIVLVAQVHAADTADFGSASPSLAACRLTGVPTPARCGHFDVPENPARPEGRHLSIAVAVLPARSTPRRRDPMVFFSGGPGESAIDSASDVGADLASMFADRDIVLIDQRGTGRSSSLACDLEAGKHAVAAVEHFLPPASIERCRNALQVRADLTQYSFLRFADDVEHVRRALGYDPVNLYTLSYGTRAAQVYLRAYPESVRTAYLGSVVPIDIPMPLPFARVAQDTLEATNAACEHDAACAAAFPALRQETKEVFARLSTGKVEVAVPGTQANAHPGAGRVAERLRSMMYKPAGAADVPWTIHRAFLGDWKPIVDGTLEGESGFSSDMSTGVFFSITCAEDVRFIRETDIAPAVSGTYLGDFRVREQQAACAHWPKAELPAGYREPVHSSVPTLFVSGDLDPATPKAFADHVAAGFTHHADLLLRGQGHSGWSDCAARVYQAFVRSGSAEGLDTTCAPTPRPAFRTR